VRFDVAIVGAGPAGARAAYVLARCGALVAIFDPSHPREKPCGGGVTGRALALVADAVDAGAWPSTAIARARFVDSGRGLSADVSLDAGALYVTSRATFDRALLDAAVRAGAALETTRVRDVAIAADGVTLHTDAGPRHADIVLGADGANSLVRRRAAAPFRRDQLSIATGFFAHGVTSDAIVIELTANPPGYIWSFPRPDHLAIGICGQADAGETSAALRDRVAAWIHASAATSLPAEAAERRRWEPYSWPIPSLSAADFGALAVSGPRWLLLGDAAGLVDPITREGIFFALASGDWAADALLSPYAGGRYAARVRDDAGAELSRAARLKAGFFRPAFTGLMMQALDESERIRRVMADLVAGQQSYGGLRWRLLATFEWRLAARLVGISSP
jgi:geranylgeranyl reductase family protein